MKHKNTATVDCGALCQNFSSVQTIVSRQTPSGNPPPQVICVVKADAYGHGIETAAAALGNAGCTFFAVSSEEEAAELRRIETRNGRHPSILILGHIDPDNVAQMLEDDIICTVVSAENARLLADAVETIRRTSDPNARLRVHVKLDTGMNRVGFPADAERRNRTIEEITALSHDDRLALCGIFTHFSVADDELMDGKITGFGYTDMQLTRYRAVTETLLANGVHIGLRHAANSAAILCYPEAYFDAVRAGVILYGLPPNGKQTPAFAAKFRPVMQFSSTVTHLHTVRKGDKISYGATYTADSDRLIATVAAGYADGFERAFTGCSVKINGVLYPQVGRICMDQFMVDVTPPPMEEPDVRVGDRVILFGGDDGSMIRNLAERAGTIQYEIICQVSKRVTRLPINA